MRKPRKLTAAAVIEVAPTAVAVVDDLANAQAALAEAQAIHARQLEELTAADRAAKAAEEFWETCSDDEATTARERRDATKRTFEDLVGQKEHVRTARRVTDAQARVKQLEEREERAELARLVPMLQVYGGELQQVAMGLVEVDRRAAQLGAAFAAADAKHKVLYGKARPLAEKLGVAVATLGPVVAVEDAAILIRRMVDAAREQDGATHRASVYEMLMSPPPVGLAAELSAAAALDLERVSARARAIQRDTEIARAAHAAGYEAGRQSQVTESHEESQVQ